VGSNKHMHTVIEAYCTGCELCLPVCPVDCIFLEDTSVAAHAVGGAIGSAQATGWAAWPQALADTARQRYEFSSYRRKREKDENAKRLEEKAQAKLADLPGQSMHTDAVVLDQKRAAIQAALERARAKRQAAE
jgi:electron transport complex protein RnfB